MTHLTFPIRSTKLSMSVEIKKHLCQIESPFQKIDIYDTYAFGKALFLDGHVQLAELDERAYHESLVHIPLLSVENPKRALVVGGGDGGVLRELVKHGSLETIEMVEIDRAVVEASLLHLPFVSDGAFDDPRVQVYYEDAFVFLKEVKTPYDLIIMDITDVYEEEDGALSQQLFSTSFHRDCLNALCADGFLVTQADNHVFCPYSLEAILRDFKSVFPHVGSYQGLVPSFGGFSAFAWASKGGTLAESFPVVKASQIELTYLDDITYGLAMKRLPFHLSEPY